ncbi:MAG: hypothetical protein WB819_00500 [Terriglobia bacterium]
MRTNFMKTIGLALFITLLMPAGMLFAKESVQATGLTSNTSNWYDVEEASNLLNRMQTLALNARNAIGQIQVAETDLGWQIQAVKLDRARNNVNKMGEDLVRLDEISSKVEPWQQRLIHKVSPRVHEMAYQLDAAINSLNQYQSKDHLALTEYPQNINMIYRDANQMSDAIGTVTQYAHAEQKMAALNSISSTNAGS